MQSCESLRIFNSGRHIFDLSQLSDAKLRTEDGCTFDIHRIILANCSDYFGDLFCGIDRDKREFTIPEMSGECLNNILCYAYTEDIEVTERNIKDLIIAADYLLLNKNFLKKVKEDIECYITELNCIGIMKAAHQFDEDIFQKCFRFIQTNFEGLVRRKMDELADLPLEVFRSILSNRSLYVYNETTVWQAIVEWTQKDIPFRMCCVPQLLLTLAMEDTDEELATEILQHEIISKNFLMKDLRPLNDFTSNLDVFLSFMRSYSSPFPQPYSHRIPLNLYALLSRHYLDITGAGVCYEMHITYDENLDLWRKITEVEIFQPRCLIALGYNIYVFSLSHCRKFDLSAMDWVTMEDIGSLHFDSSVVAIDEYIYFLGENPNIDSYELKMYDTVNNRWFAGVLLPDICYGAFVTIEKKIYLVGNSRSSDGMIMQMIDPVSQKWSFLSPPTVSRSQFSLVVYHKKIYLIGGKIGDDDEEILFSNTEVYDPATNLWKELPSMPYACMNLKAVVLNDQLIVYEYCEYYFPGPEKNMRWNEVMECWEKLDDADSLNNLRYCMLCSVDNVDTIRMITKQNRDPRTQMEKGFLA